MAYKLIDDYLPEVNLRLRGHTGIEEDDKERLIKQAVEDVYSMDRPLVLPTDITGTGDFDYALASNISTWEKDVSEVRGVDYPYLSTDSTPNFLDEDGFTVIKYTDGTEYLRLYHYSPSTDQTLRVYTTSRYLFGDDEEVDVPTADFRPTCDLAASLCLEALASLYLSKRENAVAADTVDNASKARDASDLAKRYRKRYDDHMKRYEPQAAGVVKLERA